MLKRQVGSSFIMLSSKQNLWRRALLHVIIMNASWQPNYSSVLMVFRLIFSWSKAKGSLKLIVEPKYFCLPARLRYYSFTRYHHDLKSIVSLVQHSTNLESKMSLNIIIEVWRGQCQQSLQMVQLPWAT